MVSVLAWPLVEEESSVPVDVPPPVARLDAPQVRSEQAQFDSVGPPVDGSSPDDSVAPVADGLPLVKRAGY